MHGLRGCKDLMRCDSAGTIGHQVLYVQS